MQIKLVSLIVDEQQKALKFYTEVLGFAKKSDIPLASHRWLTVVAPNDPAQVELALEASQRPEVRAFQKTLYANSIPQLTFFSQDVQKESEELSAKGVVFRVPPTEAEWGLYAVFEDTCGNLIQLHENRGMDGRLPALT